jgi:hypothetical protein
MNRDEILKNLFRSNSQAHRVAEALTDGEPHSRIELSKVAGGVSPTSVPRVVRMLREAGEIVDESYAPGGREKIFQMPTMKKRPASKRRDGKTATVDASIVSIEIEGTTTVVVTFDMSDGSEEPVRVEANPDHSFSILALGKTIQVV